MDLTLILELSTLGLCTGFLAGLLGIGGGMVLTPFLTIILSHAGGIPTEHLIHVAIATSMSTIMFTSMSSITAHARHGGVLWRIAFAIAPGILVGGIIGAQITGFLPAFWVAIIFTCFVGYSATKMFLGKKEGKVGTLPGPAGLFGAGSVIGIVSALVGAGGGFISVPFLTYFNVKIHQAIGTSATLGFPIAVAGTIGYVISGWSVETLPGWPTMLGFIHIPALLSVAVTSILSAPLGAAVSHRIDTKKLKRIFACLLYVLAGYMLYKAIYVF